MSRSDEGQSVRVEKRTRLDVLCFMYIESLFFLCVFLVLGTGPTLSLKRVAGRSVRSHQTDRDRAAFRGRVCGVLFVVQEPLPNSQVVTYICKGCATSQISILKLLLFTAVANAHVIS